MTIKSLRTLVALLCLFLISGTVHSQGFSFRCARDTVVPACPPGLCITLKSLIPNPHRQANNYAVGATGALPSCLLASANPGIPGSPTTLNIDDRYSPVFPIGFPFVFFGAPYSNLVVSSNGYLSFDVTRTGLFSHWNIINGGTPQNLPSTFYDKALIMGPYHDIDVGITTSPNRLISYQTAGLAPYRKWILNYFRIPLFSGACNNLIENTHQIVLYESTGIIDVNIFDMQICTGWNQGRAMIGVQDFNQTTGVMVTGRRATDPPWGAIGMNESYRFVPIGGTPLFRRVELYDLGGNLISTGTTVDLGNGDREASFPNVCVPPGSSTPFVIKAFYDKIDDPTTEIYATDTVNIDRAQGLAGTASSSAASCAASNGAITVGTVTGGTGPYEYSLDGITWQPSNIFTGLPAGSYTVQIRDASGACTRSVPVTISVAGTLPATTNMTAAACTGVNNGTITITTAGASGPYTFSLDGAAPQPGVLPFTFTGLAPGTHTVVVRDVPSGCASSTISLTIATSSGVTASTSTSATSCAGAANGSITANATSGVAPFTYQLDGGGFLSGSNPYTFSNVSAGSHTVIIRDNAGCTRTITVNVANGIGLNASTSSSATSCSGASNGTILANPLNGSAPFTFTLDGGTPISAPAPYTFTNVPAGGHTVVIRDANGCVSNTININVAAGPALTTSINKTDALCNGSATGTITVTQPTIGIAPYEYSLDGITWQSSNIFNGITAGTYTVYYREANGCQGSQPVSIAEPTVLSATASTVAAVCNGQSNGIINVSSSGGVAPHEYSIDGGTTWQSSTVFNAPAGAYTVTIRDANNCTTTQQVTITEPAALSATAANSAASCDGGNDGVINITAGGGNSGYQYSIDGTTFQSLNTFNVAPGNYTVTVKDNLGCTTSFPTTVPLANNLSFTPQTNPTICEGTSTQLALTSNATQYTWTPKLGLSDSSIYNPVANPVVTTQYIVTATLGRCSGNDTVIVNVNAAPIPNAGTDGFICYGQTYRLQATGGTQYSWTPSTYLDNPSSPNPISTPTKDVTYTLSILSDNNGCASLTTDQIFIDVTPPIKVRTFPYDTVAYTNDQIQLIAIPSDPDVIYYTWTPTIGLSDPTLPNPVVTTGAIGDVVRYRVVTSTIAGCKGEGFVTIRVYKGPDIYMPTGFTPNNDGKNDRFTPFPVGIKSYKYFRVYNRWGQLIFSTNQLHEGWDGKLSGKDQASGIYVWMIEGITNDNRVITKKGTVTLLR